MSYTFTHTNTVLPFGYQVKCEFVSDGTGSNFSATNGGYIVSVGKIAQKVDGLLGEYSLPSVTFAVRNVGAYFTGTLFAGSFTKIRVNIWLSYDAGTTWENVFFGQIDLKSIQEVHTSATESATRIFNFTAKHMMLTLKDYTAAAGYVPSLDQPAGGMLKTLQASTVASVATLIMPDAYTYAVQYPPFLSITGMFYATDIFDFAYGTIPMNYLGWPLSWNVTNDYSRLEHAFYSATGAGASGNIAKLAIGVGEKSAGIYRYFTHGGVSGTRPSPFSDTITFPDESKTWFDVARDLNTSLFTIIDPVMSWNGGAPTVSLNHKPRVMGGTAAAISGTLPAPLSVSVDHANWVTGISVSTRGLGTPTATDTGTTNTGQQIIYQTKLMTLANPASPVVTTWTNLQHLEEVGSRYDYPWMNQMFLYTNPGVSEVVRDVHQVKILASQSAFPSSIPSASASYGLQDAIYDILYANCPISLYNPLTAKQYSFTFRTLKGSNVADLALMKTLPFTPYGGSAETLLITGIDRDIMRNLTTITAYKVI